MILDKLKTSLLAVVDDVYRYQAPDNAPVPYAVWAEDTRFDFEADGTHAERAWQGTIDYYTRTEGDETVEDIEDCLTGLDIPWKLNSIQYEEDTGIIHFEWVWNTYGDATMEEYST